MGWFTGWKEKLEDQVWERWHPGSPGDHCLIWGPCWGICRSRFQSLSQLLLCDIVESCAGRGRGMLMDSPIRLYLIREGKVPQTASPPRVGNGFSQGHRHRQPPRCVNCYNHKFQNMHYTNSVFLKAVLRYKILPVLSVQFNDFNKCIAL